MRTKKMYERINWYKKEYVYEHYTRIVENIKQYERISKKKMLENIYNVYEDYNNIIDICTTRELKFLKKLFNKDGDIKELLSDKYEWERRILRNKFLIQDDYDDVFIPDEILDNVKLAIKNVNWSEAKRLDNLNEILVGYCKVQVSSLLDAVCSFGAAVTGLEEDFIWNHMLNNKLFNYYVYIDSEYLELMDDDVPIAVYQDYYGYEEELSEERKKQGIVGSLPVDLDLYRNLFYNDFDMKNKKIKKMLEELKELPFFWFSALDSIKVFAALNRDRKPLKDSFREVPALKYVDLTKFFKVLDDAMDEMPSGALNGFTPNQAKKMKAEAIKADLEKEKNYTKQQNACLSKQDAKLFYKIYFGLLEFTNNKYRIKPKLKIYNKLGLNPYELISIVEKYWENKVTITEEFCKVNPYKFSENELSITNEFKKGFRDVVIVTKYENEYTAVMSKDRTYMIKGINDNLDNIISYQKLPEPIITSIIPFKDLLIYDGILLEMGIKLGNNFDKTVMKEYEQSIKYYHL